jgi:hypothetical protein
MTGPGPHPKVGLFRNKKMKCFALPECDTSLIAIPDTCGTRMTRTYKRGIAAFKKG